MRKILVGLGVLVLILVLIVVIAPFVIPGEVYRTQLVAAVQNATGRQLKIDGPISVTILPNLAVEANGVALSNAPGGTAKDMAALGKLEVGVKLLPLLSGTVEIDRFTLVDPVIHLEIDKAGHANWDFKSASATAPTSPSPTAPAAGPATVRQSETLRQLSLGDVKLVNGTIDYVDARNGTRQAFDHVDVTVKLPSLDVPAAIEGSVGWRSKIVKLDVAIDRPRALLGEGASAVKASVSSDPVSLSFNGNVTGGEPMKATGALGLDIPSIRELAAWTGNPVTLRGDGLNKFSVKGTLVASGKSYGLNGIALALDAMKATGDVTVDLAGAKPALKGKLDVDMLDLNPYLAPTTTAAATPPASAAAVPPAAPHPTSPTAAAAPAAGWSTQPIDFSPLKTVDANLALSAGGIRYRKIEIGKSVLGVELQNGRLTADLNQLALYQGNGKGKIVLDSTGGVPALDTSFALTGVQSEPLLTAAADFSRVTGTGEMNLAVAGRGVSQRDIVSSLAGKGNFGFHNGKIKGLDMVAMVKNVTQSFLSAASGGSQQTEFSELGGSFTIANGIAKNDDLSLKSPVIQLAGAGTVDLPQQRLDFRVEPTVGLGGQNIAVPVRITGPWSNLSYQPDLKSMLSQKLGKPGDLLKSLTGTPGGANTGSSAPPKSTKPADLLKGLFK